MTMVSSCGMQSQIVSNENVNQTTVGLNRKNYKVVDVVKGKASNTYIFGIGGMSKKALMESAKLKMYNTNYLIGKSAAYANMTTESRISMFFPFYYKRTIISSAILIEFTE
jgi:hypothetical protein